MLCVCVCCVCCCVCCLLYVFVCIVSFFIQFAQLGCSHSGSLCSRRHERLCALPFCADGGGHSSVALLLPLSRLSSPLLTSLTLSLSLSLSLSLLVSLFFSFSQFLLLTCEVLTVSLLQYFFFAPHETECAFSFMCSSFSFLNKTCVNQSSSLATTPSMSNNASLTTNLSLLSLIALLLMCLSDMYMYMESVNYATAG